MLYHSSWTQQRLESFLPPTISDWIQCESKRLSWYTLKKSLLRLILPNSTSWRFRTWQLKKVETINSFYKFVFDRGDYNLECLNWLSPFLKSDKTFAIFQHDGYFEILSEWLKIYFKGKYTVSAVFFNIWWLITC
jgi:hypothetical protein